MTNEVFRYMYDRLGNFSKRVSTLTIIEIYKNWMNDVCDIVVGETKEHEPADRLLYPFTQMDKLDVDKVFMRIATEGAWPGTFREYFKRNEPLLLKEWQKQHPEEIYTVLPRLGDDTYAVQNCILRSERNFRERTQGITSKYLRLQMKSKLGSYIPVNDLYPMRDADTDWPTEIYGNWVDAYYAALADEIIKEDEKKGSVDKSVIDQMVQRTAQHIGTFEEYFAKTEPLLFKAWEKQRQERLKRLPSPEIFRLEALENFKRYISSSTNYDFEGNDENRNETLTNPVFQYMYDELEEFLKKGFNSNWPIETYRNWTNYVCNTMKTNLPMGEKISKSVIDGIFWRIEPFEVYFVKTAPRTFKRWGKQYPQQKQNE